ncbi:spore gernimation protein [Paenibacillus sp. 28ISP30-2]|uniref:GerAB/ArcD/ProY family transporter n=1 Tax=Paenibacillus TaxID=44249 RepID=UPI00071F02B2|nr:MULTISPECIES: GerAB/ArcD/ProY family transporter [Paenibacillus]ALP37108.1 spore gernimation protein [Paenibacillus sp. IHB B 3084]MBE0340092.1 spore gernimation protein [Paenibacillus sp. 28ISP30-2]
MKKEQVIDAMEMISLMLLFELGTTVISIPGRDAGKDAWLAILLSTGFGALLFFCYGTLHRRFPGMLLTQYIKVITGRKVGSVLAFLYILFFLYGGTRDLRDAGILISDTTLFRTPLAVISALIIGVVMYVMYLGIEAAGRTAIWLLSFLLLLGLTTTILLSLSGSIDWKNMMPIAQHGWGEIWKAVYTEGIMLPFGEMVTFTMILPSLKKDYRANVVGITSVLLGGIAFSLIALINVLVLGEDLFQRATYPLLTMIGKVEITDFIDRLDVIGVMTVIIVDFFKIFIFFYAAVKAGSDVLRVPPDRLLLPFGLIMLTSSLLMAQSYQEHIAIGQFVLKWMFPTFSVIFPLLLLIVSGFRKKGSSKGKGNAS